MQITGQSIIGYRRGDTNGAELHGFNPRTGESIEPAFHSASGADLDHAVGLGSESFSTYGWLTAKKRASFLRQIAENLEGLGEELIERAVAETALTAARIRSERGRTCFQLRFFGDILEEGSWVDARIDSPDPARQPAPKPDVRSMRRPLGPIAIFCASNFPLAFSVAGGDTASALASGNPVIVLAHYSHPGTAELAGMAVRNAAFEMGLPEGVFSLLYDAGHNVANALVAHPQIRGVAFTGSRSGGTALMKVASSRPEPIPFYAEMSSVNPVFILPSVLKSRAESIANGLHASVTLGVGQFCTNPGVVVTIDDDSSFVSQLAALMHATPSGTMLNQRISSSYRSAISERMARPQVNSRAMQTQEIGNVEKSCQSGASLFETDAKSWLADRTLHDEIFGPSTLLVRARAREEVLDIARSLEGNLTATIHGSEEDLREFSDLIAILETKVGRIIFNGFPTGVEVCQAIVHGGPYPATSDGRSTSVGGRAILRFTRAVCFQDFPESVLPDELKMSNPLGIWRLVDGRYTK
jgi:alpha-ketoglutaric semialdehyde dehydrogenase